MKKLLNFIVENGYPIFTFFAGWAVAKILDIYFKICREKWQNWKLERDQEFLSIDFDPSKIGVSILHSWSYKHRLYPANTILSRVDTKPHTPYLVGNEAEFQKIVQNYKNQNYTGDVCYMVDYKVDHRDNVHGYNFELTVAPSDYSEASAISDYLKNHTEIKNEIINTIKDNPIEYFRQALPSDIFINLIVLSKNNNVLLLRRSNSVSSAKGKWCIGAFETMNDSLRQQTAGADINFHELARRGLKEELNLLEVNDKGQTVYDVNSIFISSISLSHYHMGTLVTAIVKLKDLTEKEITSNILSFAESKFEHDGIKWVKYDKKEIKKFIETDSGLYADCIKNDTGEWIAYAKFSLYELYRTGDFSLYNY